MTREHLRKLHGENKTIYEEQRIKNKIEDTLFDYLKGGDCVVCGTCIYTIADSELNNLLDDLYEIVLDEGGEDESKCGEPGFQGEKR